MSVDATTRALLELVDQERARQCKVVIDAASAEAAATLAQAHADARERMRRAFAQARERHAARVGAAKAELATRERIALQRRIALLLAEGWQILPDELVRRWRDPALRALWIERVVSLARELLPRGAWRITHAPDWPERERASLAALLDESPTFVVDPAHRAGLSIASSANVIDGTLEGLTADRAEVGAQLLSELQRSNEHAELAQ